jgi:predicted site-specific integrase-resolvase
MSEEVVIKATQEEVDNALTLNEVCKRTGLSMVYVRRRIATGKWHAFKDEKGRNRILVREVEEWEAWRKAADERRAERAAAKKAKAADAEEQTDIVL